MEVALGWAGVEMQGARLDTPRRLRNLVRTCENMFSNAGKSLSSALGDDVRQATYDLCSRTGRTPADLIAGHVAQTALRCTTASAAARVGRGVRRPAPILIIQDTVRLDYFTHRGCKGLGPVGGEATSYGLFGHSALAVQADGLPLGILALDFWARDPAAHGSRNYRKSRNQEDKEPQIWLTTAKAVETALQGTVAEHVPVLLVQDRGADLYQLFVQPRRETTYILLRAYQPRHAEVLAEPDAPYTAAEACHECLETTPVDAAEPPALLTVALLAAGSAPQPAPSLYLPEIWPQAPVRIKERLIEVSEQPARPKTPAVPARQARVEIRSAKVRIFRPVKCTASECPSRHVDLWAVWVREPAPPEGVEPLHWMLLTTWPVDDAEAAGAVVDWYSRRWQIEMLHRTLKSGLRVESYQIDDAESLMNMLALAWVVAWRTLQLTHLARVSPEQPAERCFSDDELSVLAARLGTRATTLKEAVQQVARFGGWPGHVRKQLPGVEVLWRGLRDLGVAATVWEAAKRHFLRVARAHDTS